MNKETYERAEIELFEFECDDVLTISQNPDDDYDGESAVFLFFRIISGKWSLHMSTLWRYKA